MCPQGNSLCENENCTCDPCVCGEKDDTSSEGMHGQCTE